ncbi:glycosyl hydrolase family 18 protein [Elizabethkingia ursingii]
MTNQNQQKNYPKDERIQDNILMGFWHNWPGQPNSGQQGGEPATMSITEIHQNYNVIAIAFMNVTENSDPIPNFSPFKYTDQEFSKQIQTLHEQNRVILLSLGGANANIKMQKGQEAAFSQRIIKLADKYGFDGLDINLHQTEIDAADNSHVIPEALKLVKDHYKAKGKNFIITISPEFPYLRESGKYVPYVRNLEGYYDFIAPQFYNQFNDGVLGDEGQWLTQNDDTKKEDFLFHLTKSIVTGKGYIKIPHDKFIMGVPCNIDAANSGYITNYMTIRDVFNKLEMEKISIRGLGAWSVNWDNGKSKDGEKYNWRFASDYGYLTELIGISKNNSRNLTSAISQFIEIPVKGEKYSLIGRLTSSGLEDHSKTDHLNKNNISDGVIYRIVVFDTDGKYVTQKVLTQGQHAEDIHGLISGETYKFVAYSYNNKMTPPEVKEFDNITSGLKISGENDNNFSYSYSEKKYLKPLSVVKI